MKTPRSRLLSTSIASIFPALTLLAATPAFADVTKADNTTALNVATSYTVANQIVPTSADVIIFNNTISTVTNSSAALGGDLSVAGIAFSATTAFTNATFGNGSYFIANTPGATLTLGASGIAQSSASGANLVLNTAVALGAAQAFDVGTTGRSLTLDGTRGSSLSLGGNVLTVQGAGNTLLTALVYGTGSISKAGTGTLTLNSATGSATTGNAGNLFSGGITVGTGGAVVISTANASGTGLITSSGTLTVSASQLLLTGGITVSAGTTTLSAANAAGTGTVTLNGGTLALTNNTATQLATVNLSSGTFAPVNAVTFGTLTGSQGFTATANGLTFGTNNGSGTYSGNIAGAVASNVLKQGSGTQIMNGTNATTGTIGVNGTSGTLEIGGQYNGNGAVAVNAGTLTLNFGTTNTVSADMVKSAALTLAGGKLSIVGQTGATNVTQAFTGTSFTAGTASTVSLTNGGGNTAANLVGFTRGAGSTVNFTLPSGTQSTFNGIQTTSGDGASALFRVTNKAYATVSGTDFAAKDAGDAFIVKLTGSASAGAASLGAAGVNADIDGVNGSPTVAAQTINTIRFNDSGATARTLTLSGALNVNSGGILVSSAVTAAGSKITGSTITAGATAAELIVHQFSAQPFTLDSQIIGTVALVKAGLGTLIVTKSNTNGASNVAAYVDSGALQLGAGGGFTGGAVTLAPNDPTAVFDVNNQTASVSNLSGGGGTGGYVNLGRTSNLSIVGGFGSTFNGPLVGGVDSVLTKSSNPGSQGFNASSNASFYGTANVTLGSLGFFAGASSFINGKLVVGGSGSINTGGTGTAIFFGSISGSGTLGGASGASSNGSYSFGYLGSDTLFSGAITNGSNAAPGVQSISKFGSGTTTLSGPNVYTGATTINSGGLTFDYATNVPLPTGSALTVGGGTATFLGKASGATAISTGTFGLSNSVLSKVTINGSTGTGTTLTLKTAAVNSINTLGSTSANNVVLFDLSNSGSNALVTDLAIGASDNTNATVAIRTQNGLLTTGNGNATTPTFNNYRADVFVRDSTGIGFAQASGTTISRYTGATALTASDTTTALNDNTNYKLSVNLTRGAANQFLYNTLELDSSTQAVTLITDSNGNRFGAGSATTSGRGVLATGTNGATITSAGGTNQVTFFNNYQTGTTAGQTLTLNLTLSGSTIFNGTGLTVATGLVTGSDMLFQSGVTRLTGAQSSGDALVSGAGTYRLVGGVLEIGADLTGSASSTSTADFSRTVGTNGGQVQLLGDTGFSAFGASRTVNLGGSGQQLVWGNDNFLASPAGTTTEGNNTFKLSSAFSNATIDFQNAIALGSTTRQVDVADGSATVDAKLSGVLSGVFAPTVTLSNSGAAIANAAAGLTKLGAGTLQLSAANTYTGPTNVTAGTLEISGSISGSTSVSVTGGTVLLSGAGATDNKLKSTATMALAGGAIDLSGITSTSLDQTLGTLSLSGNSSIDFGTLAGGNTFRFADSSGQNWTGATLSIYDWSPNTDHLFFGLTSGGLGSTQLSQVTFYGGSALSPGPSLGSASILSTGELVAVPEPSTLALVAGALGLVGFRERRRLCRGTAKPIA